VGITATGEAEVGKRTAVAVNNFQASHYASVEECFLNRAVEA
jgi:hypothetical protein